jgi:hypothetical protein
VPGRNQSSEEGNRRLQGSHDSHLEGCSWEILLHWLWFIVKNMFYLSISKGDDDPQVAKVFDTGDGLKHKMILEVCDLCDL